jgi:hypothetical protein
MKITKPKIKKLFSPRSKRRWIILASVVLIVAAAVFSAVKFFHKGTPKTIEATMSAEEVKKYTQQEVPAEEVFEAPQKDFKSSEEVKFKIQIPKNIPEVKPENKVIAPPSQTAPAENPSEDISPEVETPQSVPPSQGGNEGGLENQSDETSVLPANFRDYLGIENAYAQESVQIVRTEVSGPDGTLADITPVIQESSGELEVVIPKPEANFDPGKYELKVYFLANNQIITATQDFSWGVLAINANKSIYSPGETGKLAMAVLDENGGMVCDAKVRLKVKSQKFPPEADQPLAEKVQGEELSTENGRIKINPECQSKAVTSKPDYEAEYQFGKEGTYDLILTAETANGTYEIADSLEVKKDIPFDVGRISATRIYPLHKYPVKINITANQDFKGEIRETVPEGFEITEISNSGVIASEAKQSQENGIAASPSSPRNDKQITWPNISLKKGEKLELSYQYDAPDISPQFYLLGPLQFKENNKTVFQEARQWQIAADDIITNQFIISGTADDPVATGTTEYSCLMGDGNSAWTSTENARKGLIATGGILKNFKVRVGVAPGAGNSWTFAIRVSGADSNLSVSIADTNTVSSLDTSEVSVSAGEDVSISAVGISSPTAAAAVQWTAEFVPTAPANSAETILLSSSNGTGFTNNNHRTLVGNKADEATEFDAQIVFPTAGTLKKLYLELSTAPGAGTSKGVVVTLNAVDTSLAATVSDSATTASDTSNTVDIAAGDSVNYREAVAGSPAASYEFFGIVFEPDVAGEYITPAVTDDATSSTAAEYQQLTTGDSGLTATESEQYGLAQATTAKAMYVKLSAAPASGNTWTFRLKDDTADTSLITSIADTATSGNYATDVSIAADSVLDTAIDAQAGTAVASTQISYLFYNEPESTDITVSGGCFTDATEGTACTNDGTNIIKVAVNGVVQETFDLVVDGDWSFNIEQPPSGATLVFFIDGEDTESEEATTVVKYDGDGGDVDGVKMYQSHLVIGTDSGSANDPQTIATADLESTAGNGYENGDDSEEDVLYSVASSDLTVDDDNNKTETLYIIGGNTYRPASGGGGDTTTLNLYNEGTLTLDNNALNISGEFTNTGSFTSSGSSMTFTSSSNTSIPVGTYDNLTLAPSGGSNPTYTLGTAGSQTITTQNLTIGDGTNSVTVTAASNNPIINVAGDVVINNHGAFTGGSEDITVGTDGTTDGDFTIESGGTWTAGAGTLILDGGDGSNLVYFNDKNGSKQNMGHVQIGASPAETNLSSDMNATDLTIAAGDVLNTHGYDITLTDFLTCNGTLNVDDDVETGETIITLGGNFTMDSGGTYTDTDYDSEIIFLGNASADQAFTTGGKTYGLVTLNNDEGTYDDLDVSGAFNVNGTLTITDGVLDLNANDPASDINAAVSIGASGTLSASNSGAFNLSGSYTNSGTFTANSGAVTLDGAAEQNMAGTMTGSSAFYDLTITNNSGASASDNERTGFTPSVDFDAAANATHNFAINTVHVRVEFETGTTYEFAGIDWTGAATTDMIYFRNSTTADSWTIRVTGTQTDVSYVNVSRSTADLTGGGQTIDADNTTNYDAQNNTNWDFTADSSPVEFVSVVDPGGTGDYSSLSAWNTGIVTDLTAATTQVFSGTRNNTVADNATVYLCRGESYQSHSATVVHATSTQILVDAITGSATETSGDTWESASNCAGTTYFTISDGGNSAIAVATCRTTNGAADTTAVTISGWGTSDTNYIKIWTDPDEPYRHQGVWDDTKYRLEVGAIASDPGAAINVWAYNVRIEGLQMRHTSTHASYENDDLVFYGADTAASDYRVSDNIIRGVTNAANYHSGIVIVDAGGAGSTARIYNNIVYDFNGSSDHSGIYGSDDNITFYVYNNTVINVEYGYYRGGGTYIAKNNIAQNCTDSFNGTFDSSSTYNITDLSAAEGAGGASADSGTTTSATAYKLIQTGQNFTSTVKVGMIVKDSGTNYSYVTAIDSDTQLSLNDDIMGSGETYTIYTNMYGNAAFADEANDDFHLDSSDTVAKNKGANLYADGSLAITTDIDGNARPNSATLFDIGADENYAKIYRSVAPDADGDMAALTTGTSNYQTNHLTVSGLYATFELPLADNIGVGDAIQYDDDNDGDIDGSDSIVFIDKRFSEQKYRVKTASGAAPAATTAADIDWSLFRSYTSLAKAESVDTNADENNAIDDDLENFDDWSSGQDLVTAQKIWNIAAYANGTTADATAVRVDGWTTSADAYINIFTPTRIDEVGESQRHQGIWDDDKYKIVATPGSNYGVIYISDNYVTIDGLQVEPTGSNTYVHGITYDQANYGTIKNCIIVGGGAGSAEYFGIQYYNSSVGDIYNNMVYNFSTGGIGIYMNSFENGHVYNNTVYDCETGYQNDGGTNLPVLINNIAQDVVSYGYYGSSYSTSSSNNCSDDDTQPGGSGRNGEVAFVDETGNDFHLAPNDTIAKNSGTDLTNDLSLNFNTDIDDAEIPLSPPFTKGENSSRPYNTTWDIGADEVITPIYRSVAPDADGSMAAIDDDNSQADTLTITTAGVATFEVAVADIVGVGDALIFDDDADEDLDVNDTILFIHGRTDSTHYTVKTDTGLNPTAGTTDNNKWAIYRAYTSLFNAEAGTKNTAIPITFTGGNRDIKANSEQWNIACYANGTTADNTATTINGWTTAPQNYIKVYTPVSTSEVGTSQRHQGVWTTSKYYMSMSDATAINANNLLNVKIDGIQISVSGLTAARYGITFSNAPSNGYAFEVSNSIIRRADTNANTGNGIYLYFTGSSRTGTLKIFNNIIYDWSDSGTNSHGIFLNDNTTAYIYNNTINYCDTGMRRNAGSAITVIAKNNLIKNDGAVGHYAALGTFDAGTGYNATNKSSMNYTVTGGAVGDRTSQTFTFTDESGDDFHLATTDAGAKDYGADLSTDPYYPLNPISPLYTDIDGSQRPLSGSGLSWDIGADEVATPIYRSVGPSATTYLATGASNHLNISGSTATFDTAPGTNIGVGDALEYDANNSGTINAVAFISARISGTEFSVKSAVGGTPTPQTTADEIHWNIFRASATLSNAEAGIENSGLSDTVQNFDDWTTGGAIGDDEAGRNIWTNNEQWNIAAYANGTTADQGAVYLDNWTTSPTDYLNIYTPYLTIEVGVSQRHQGKWDDSKFKIEPSSDDHGILVDWPNSTTPGHVRVEGLQITVPNNDYRKGIWFAKSNYASDNDFQANSNIVRAASGSANYRSGINGRDDVPVKFWNNLVYNFTNTGEAGIYCRRDTAPLCLVYNNTVINNTTGVLEGGYGDTRLINNIAKGCDTAFSGYFGYAYNNATDSATGPDGVDLSSNRTSQNFNFVDEAGKDFHLDPTDISARNQGADLSADTSLPVTTDIDGKARPNQGIFDIGADEAAKGVYYSVGQNVTDHGSGGDITILNGLATFTVAQTATNLGVGDKVTYNGASIAYLLRKVDTTHWYIVTATGAIPADDATPRTVNTITHTFASLSDAEDDADDGGYMASADLVTNDFQLNIPCYNDAGAADTVAVTVDGYTTGSNNFIKIYTPVDTATEANTRQRHWGKWDDGKYNLYITTGNMFDIQDSNIWMDGLQVRIANAGGGDSIGVYINGSVYTGIKISNNVFRGNGVTGSADHSGIFLGSTTDGSTMQIYNNLIYDWKTYGIWESWSEGSDFYVYSNTISGPNSGTNIGILNQSSANSFVLKNNIVQNCSDGYSGSFDSSSDYNISDIDASDAPNATFTNDYGNVSFLDETNKDFHLGLTDTMARNVGTNLSADSAHSFSTDIDGNGRSLWDIGADEGSVEMEATVMQAGGDYSSLSGWETGMGTDLTAPATMIFSGTRTNAIADNAGLYLCRSGTYQNITADTVHSMASQILVENVSNPSFVMAASDVWYTADTCDSSNYFTISTAGGDPVIAVAKIDGAWTSADAGVTINGWTTGPTNYVKVYTTTAARHPGKWDDTKYRIVSSDDYIINAISSDIRIDGLQIHSTPTSGDKFAIAQSGFCPSAFERQISNNIIKGSNASSGAHRGIHTATALYRGSVWKVWNNIIYDIGTTNTSLGIDVTPTNGYAYIYNNLVYNTYYGYLNADNGGVGVFKNNIAQNCTDGFYASWAFGAGSDYNLSDLTSDAPSTSYHSGEAIEVTFVNENKDDFHLANDDLYAKDGGTDLGADTNLAVDVDIDGSTRVGTHDIGADEASTMIYYSVGQNTNNNETGAGNVDVDATARTATFTVAQTATNMGVGDVIDYGGSNYECYITEKVSTTIWKCQSATGGAPTDSGGDVVVNSIHHTFQYLVNAEDDSDDAGYLATANLVTGNYVLNIPCYYDTGPDTSDTIVDDYTTSSANYIRIYTPTNTDTEANTSQRHSGKFSTSKYYISQSAAYYSLIIGDQYVKVDGIQVSMDNTGTRGGIDLSGTYIGANPHEAYISNNIVRATVAASSNGWGINVGTYDEGQYTYIWNNLVYDQTSGGIRAEGNGYIRIYNNTVINSDTGISGAANIIVKNNLAKGNSSNDYYSWSSQWHADSTNNASGDATAPGSNNRISQTFSFVDETGDDFHLAFADTGAKGYGTNLMNDTYLAFQNDIDGQERTGNWTIGADEPREAEIQSSTQKVESITDGLVLYQSFDGPHMDWSDTDAEARDQSGQNNNGDVSGAVAARGRKGQALSFAADDVNEDESPMIGLGTDFNISSLPFSISVWVNPADYSNYRMIIAKRDNWDTSNMRFQLQLDSGSGNVSFAGSPDNLHGFSYAPPLNTWTLLTVTASGSATDLYVNGVFEESMSGFILGTDSAANTEIGRNGENSADTDPYNGLLDELRVYDRALSPDEIGDLYRLGEMEINSSQTDNAKSGIVGMWSFDGPDINGTNAYDRSGNGYDGTITNAVPGRGKKGQALSFDGDDDYVDTADIDITDQITVSAWIKTSAQGSVSYHRIIDKNYVSSWYFGSRASGSYNLSIWMSGSERAYTADNVYSSGQWTHAAFTYDKDAGGTDEIKIYVNGAQVATGDYSTAIGINAYPIRIGWSPNGSGNLWNGQIDEIRIYNTALTSDQVGDLYRMGTAELGR